MKYTILINQKVWLEKYPKIDVLSIAIFEVISRMCGVSAKHLKRIIHENEEYVWVNYSEVIKELPLFHVKSTSTIAERIKILKKIGLIKTFRAPDRTIYIRI